MSQPNGSNVTAGRNPRSDLYRRRPAPMTPYSVYFHYEDEQGNKKSYFYDHGSEITNLRSIIKKLVRNARANGDDPAQMPPSTPMRRKSFVVFAVDDNLASLLEPGNAARAEPRTGNANGSFFDGRDYIMNIEDEAGNPRQVSIFRCKNHMLDERKTPLGEGKREKFYFYLHFIPPRLRGRDGSTTNLGGRVPPPP
jgi:hypothetical protein